MFGPGTGYRCLGRPDRYQRTSRRNWLDPDYYSYYIEQDTQPEGRIGIFISHLVMPEDYREEDFFTLADKSLQYIPWPIRDLVQVDQGLVLLDKKKFYEFEEFTPTELIDHTGSSVGYRRRTLHRQI